MTVTPSSGGSHAQGPNLLIRRLLDLAEEATQAVRTADVETGMRNTIEREYDWWPDVLEAFAGMLDAAGIRAAEMHAVTPPVVDLFVAFAGNTRAQAGAAAYIGATTRSIMRDRLDDLERPRQRQWDVAANQDGGPAPDERLPDSMARGGVTDVYRRAGW